MRPPAQIVHTDLAAGRTRLADLPVVGTAAQEVIATAAQEEALQLAGRVSSPQSRPEDPWRSLRSFQTSLLCWGATTVRMVNSTPCCYRKNNGIAPFLE